MSSYTDITIKGEIVASVHGEGWQPLYERNWRTIELDNGHKLILNTKEYLIAMARAKHQLPCVSMLCPEDYEEGTNEEGNWYIKYIGSKDD